MISRRDDDLEMGNAPSRFGQKDIELHRLKERSQRRQFIGIGTGIDRVPGQVQRKVSLQPRRQRQVLNQLVAGEAEVESVPGTAALEFDRHQQQRRLAQLVGRISLVPMQEAQCQEQHVDTLLLQIGLCLGVDLEQVEKQALFRQRSLQSGVCVPSGRTRSILGVAVGAQISAPGHAFQLMQQFQRRLILCNDCLVIRAPCTGDLAQSLLRHVRKSHRLALTVEQFEYRRAPGNHEPQIDAAAVPQPPRRVAAAGA